MSTHAGPLGSETSETGASHSGRPRHWHLVARPGLAVSLLCWAGSILLAVSALIHLHLWSTGYQDIPTIGPLFLMQVVAGFAMAVVVAVLRQVLVAVAGALFALSTIGGLVLSVEVGLFGFTDNFSAPYATTSLIVEAAAFVVLGAASVVGILNARSAGSSVLTSLWS